MKEMNILGFGTMARQIAALFLLLGYKIHLYNRSAIEEKLLFKQVRLLEKKLPHLRAKGGGISFYLGFNILKDLPTLESVSEDLSIKKELILGFQKEFKSPIFSNSSSLSYHDLCCPLMHFFNPIYLSLVEVYDPNDQGSQLIMDLKSSGFTIIISKGNRGSLANQILFAEISNILKIIEQYHYSQEQCQIIYDFLYERRNIFNIIDSIGIELCEQICKNIHEEDENFYHPQSFKKALSRNILGRKNKTSIKEVLFSNQKSLIH